MKDAEMKVPSYEQYILTKAERQGHELSWCYARRCLKSMAEEELKAMIERQKRSVSRVLHGEEDIYSKREQLSQLIKDRSWLEIDHRFWWFVEDLELQNEEGHKSLSESMTVVIKRVERYCVLTASAHQTPDTALSDAGYRRITHKEKAPGSRKRLSRIIKKQMLREVVTCL